MFKLKHINGFQIPHSEENRYTGGDVSIDPLPETGPGPQEMHVNFVRRKPIFPIYPPIKFLNTYSSYLQENYCCKELMC